MTYLHAHKMRLARVITSCVHSYQTKYAAITAEPTVVELIAFS